MNDKRGSSNLSSCQVDDFNLSMALSINKGQFQPWYAAEYCAKMALIVIVSLIVGLQPVIAKAIVSHRVKRAPIYDNVQTYLTKFGYLPQSDIETGNLRTDDQLKDAIKTLQMFANIPVTGQVDEVTANLLKRPRCGLPDKYDDKQKRRKRYTLHGQRWDHTNLTWSLRSKYIQNLSYERVRFELGKALNIWAKSSKLSFREILNDDADILVYFESGYHGDGFPFDGRGQILAHAFFPGTGRGGDAHFDEEELWLTNGESTSEGTSLFAVAAHEFGHSLGLAHSSVSGSLMFPWYQGLKDDFELPEDDKLAVQELYGVRERSPERPTDVPRRTRPSTEEPTTSTIYPRPPKKVPASFPPYYFPKPTRPTHTYPPAYKPPRPVGEPPDTCDTSYDAISVIRKDTFIFKDRWIWRIGENGLYPGYPNLIDRLWYKLPSNVTHVDAVYERYDGKIVFFIGKNIYLFNGNLLMAGYPKPLTSLGLPETLDHIDGAMIWGYNSKTYLFSGTMYWRFDDEVDKVELDYPRDMSIWKGVGYNIDAVFQWKDGATYFFKGKSFWKFNDLRMRVHNAKPTPSAPFWMRCPTVLQSSQPTVEVETQNFHSNSDIFRSFGRTNTPTRLILSSLLLIVFNFMSPFS